MLSFAAGRGLIAGNPWAGLHLPPGVASRERRLSDGEWQAVASEAKAAPYPWGPFLLALMMSAQRLKEVARMEWSEIEDELWIIPAQRHKSLRGHEVPLSVELVGLLRGLPRHERFVFSTRAGLPIAAGSKIVR